MEFFSSKEIIESGSLIAANPGVQRNVVFPDIDKVFAFIVLESHAYWGRANLRNKKLHSFAIHPLSTSKSRNLWRVQALLSAILSSPAIH